MPALLEQLRYYLFWIPDVEKLAAQPKHSAPQSDEAGWRYINGTIPIWFPTKWAANFAQYLEFLRRDGQIVSWAYQPRTFRLTGIRSGYVPDFAVTCADDTHFWIEIKAEEFDALGCVDLLEKTLGFEAEYPDERLIQPDGGWFEENLASLKRHIPDWED